jgi:hypothetical protein
MIANAVKLPSKRMMGARDDKASRLFRMGNRVYSESIPLPAPTEECTQEEGEGSQPRACDFLLVMAAVSLVCMVGDRLIGSALLAWFGVRLDPFVLSVALYLVATLAGFGVVCCFSKTTQGPEARRHMLLTLSAAMGIGLILVWLGHFAGCAGALGWPLALVYLLWAWGAAVSAS